MSYAVLIWLVGANAVIESYSTMLDCKVREATIQKEYIGAQTSCVWVEEKQVARGLKND